MKKSLLFPVVVLILTLGSVCRSADYTKMYERDVLELAANTYNNNLEGAWEEDLIARLPDDQRTTAMRIRLILPILGDNSSPFDYYANSMLRRVYIPTLSVKFLDDLAIAFSWLDANGCDSSAVFDYVGMIRYQDFPDGAPTPLEALPVPDNPLANDHVNDISGKLLKSAIYFVMAHELGHVLLGHSGFVSLTTSQAQEIAADEYAINVMRRLSATSGEPVPPIGMVQFFMAASRFERAPGDFDSLEAFEEYVRRGVSHPLTSGRLMAMGSAIRNGANDFSGGSSSWIPRIQGIAADIESIGQTLEDRAMREYLRSRSLQTTMESLQGACN